MKRPDREIIIIPAEEQSPLKNALLRQLNTAAYCRVSTEQDEQLMSYDAQYAYYTDLIMQNPDWRFAGVFGDPGVSGASAEKRPEFMKMIRKCKAGKIDLIITKSISRFARNTLDSIGYVRQLKAMGVGVYFEKENINTLDGTSEVILTILSSLAQEELNSLSSNVKLGKRMAAKEGRVSFQYERLYAYRKGADGDPEIIPDQAEVVRRIYHSYLAGRSVGEIRKALEQDGIASPCQKDEWTATTIRNILANERYCGDVLLQKTYIVDPISKKVKKNNGELPKVFIKNNHDPIVTREEYDAAQTERAKRGSKRKTSPKPGHTEQGKYSAVHALTGMLVCGECGTAYRRIVWSKNGVKKPVWRCMSRLEYGTKYCRHSPTLDEESLQSAIMQALTDTRQQRDNLLPLLRDTLTHTLTRDYMEKNDTEQIERRMREIQTTVMELISSGDTDEGRFKALNDELQGLQSALNRLQASCGGEKELQHSLYRMNRALEQEHAMNNCEYDDNVVRSLIDTIRVVSGNKLRITFGTGYEYEQSITPNIPGLA